MEQTEEILKKLSEIENAAVAVSDDVGKEKARIKEQYEEKTKEFDQQIDAQTKKTLDELKEKLKVLMDKELDSLKQETTQESNLLDEMFHTQHTRLAKKIMAEVMGE